MSDGRELVIALTEAIQDIDAYTARDRERPARSAKVGMLPPKLAQILVNSAQGSAIYDPFCGTGVILQEALLMGHEAYGSDLAAEMVDATRTNLEVSAIGDMRPGICRRSATYAATRGAAAKPGGRGRNDTDHHR